ncbi:MAG: tetratricopeptide repeat protein [Treponema sp.]|jgi:tetratricopeptide (TPR) repeat protein|nr:tetratricopeptide repeat protein [Treponema sp.]
MKKQAGPLVALLSALVLIYVSCSSVPKNSGDIYVIRAMAEEELESGNKAASRGDYYNALLLIDESKRKAILTDAPSLIIRSGLARGNVLFYLGRTEEAFEEWEQAVAEAQKLGDGELLSVCRIYHARGGLVSGRDSAQSVLDVVNREADNVESDRYYVAFSWQVRGLALRALSRYGEAEDAVTHSLEINEKDLYLENVSYDWYTIASIRSLAGNTSGALDALESSITVDRRIENSWGLAASWRAMGDVYQKAGRSREAGEAYQRARAIYIAMGNDYEAAQIDKRMENL